MTARLPGGRTHQDGNFAKDGDFAQEGHLQRWATLQLWAKFAKDSNVVKKAQCNVLQCIASGVVIGQAPLLQRGRHLHYKGNGAIATRSKKPHKMPKLIHNN